MSRRKGLVLDANILLRAVFGQRVRELSRVENGHTVPAIETLEKMAQALESPMYQLFYDGEKPPAADIPVPKVAVGWGGSGRDAKTLHQFRKLMSRADDADLKLLLFMAQKMAQKKTRGSRA